MNIFLNLYCKRKHISGLSTNLGKKKSSYLEKYQKDYPYSKNGSSDITVTSVEGMIITWRLWVKYQNSVTSDCDYNVNFWTNSKNWKNTTKHVSHCEKKNSGIFLNLCHSNIYLNPSDVWPKGKYIAAVFDSYSEYMKILKFSNCFGIMRI